MGDGDSASRREGRSPATGQMQAAQQELSLAPQGTGAGVAVAAPGEPSCLCWRRQVPSLSRCVHPLPQALTWISPRGPLLSSSAVLPWLLLSADRASLGSLGSVQIVPRVSPLST